MKFSLPVLIQIFMEKIERMAALIIFVFGFLAALVMLVIFQEVLLDGDE